MKRLIIGVSVLVVEVLILASGVAQAAIVIGGLTFEDNAFADTVISGGGGDIFGGATTVEQAVTGCNLDTYVNGVVLELGFTDNVLTNYANAWDLVVFDILSDGDNFTVAVDFPSLYANISAFLPGPNAHLGYNGNGLVICATYVDLSDLGVPVGGTISSLAFGGQALELAAVGAINLPFPTLPSPDGTVPEPSTLIIWSLLGGLGITIGWRRRRKAA